MWRQTGSRGLGFAHNRGYLSRAAWPPRHRRTRCTRWKFQPAENAWYRRWSRLRETWRRLQESSKLPPRLAFRIPLSLFLLLSDSTDTNFSILRWGDKNTFNSREYLFLDSIFLTNVPFLEINLVFSRIDKRIDSSDRIENVAACSNRFAKECRDLCW